MKSRFLPSARVRKNDPALRPTLASQSVVAEIGLGRCRVLFARVLIVLLWALAVGPAILQKCLSPNRQVGVNEDTELVPAASATKLLLSIALVLLALFIILTLFPDAARNYPTSVLFTFIAPWALVVGEDWVREQLFSPVSLLYPAVVVTFWLCAPRFSIFACFGYLGIATAVGAMVLALVRPANGLYADLSGRTVAVDKGLFAGDLLSGMFVSTNNLGQFLTLLLPGAILISRARIRIVGIMLIGSAIFWTGSRSSIGAVVAVIVLLAASRVVKAPRLRWLLKLIVAASVGVCGLLPLFASANFSAFSNRGFIWALSLNYYAAGPIFGLGSDWFRKIAGVRSDFGDDASIFLFHAHNQIVHILVTGGALELAAFVPMIILSVRGLNYLSPREQVVAAAYLVAFFISGTFELNLGFVDRDQFWVTSLLPLLLIALQSYSIGSACTFVIRTELEPIPGARGRGVRL